MVGCSQSRARLIFGGASLLAGVVLLLLLWHPVAKGLSSLGWDPVPATTVVAYYHIEYDPVASHGMDGSFHQSWTGLTLAYTAPAGEQHVTFAFDAAGLTGGREPFPRPLPVRVEHVINQGEAARVYVNPNAPEEAVVQRGIPFTTGVALFLPMALLSLGCLALRPDRPEKSMSFGGQVATMIVVLAFFAIFAVGVSPLFLTVTGAAPPWWMLPGMSLVLLAVAAFPPIAAGKRVASTLCLLVLLMPILGVVGVIVNERDSFGQQWTDEQQLARLGHEHPVVAEYAVYHFVNDKIPPQALTPLRELVRNCPAVDTRRVAAVALGRMGAPAIPALPDLELALLSPTNESIRSDLETARRTLDNIQSFRERGGSD